MKKDILYLVELLLRVWGICYYQIYNYVIFFFNCDKNNIQNKKCYHTHCIILNIKICQYLAK